MGEIDQLTTKEKALIMTCIGFANIGFGNEITDKERDAERKIVEYLRNTTAREMSDGINDLYKKLISDYMED